MTGPAEDPGLERVRAAADAPAGELRAVVRDLAADEARRLLVDLAMTEAAWRAADSADDAEAAPTGPEAFAAALDQAARVGAALDAIADERDLHGLVAAALALSPADAALVVLEPRFRRMIGGGAS